MEKESVRAVAHGIHGVHADVRSHRVTTDRPPGAGGEDRGLMASEHLLVALASCTCTTGLKIAAKRKVQIDRLAVDADMVFDDRGEVADIMLRIHVTTPAEKAAAERVMDLAERVCTISKLLSIQPKRTVIVEHEDQK